MGLFEGFCHGYTEGYTLLMSGPEQLGLACKGWYFFEVCSAYSGPGSCKADRLTNG